MDINTKTLENKVNEDGTITIIKQQEEKLSKAEVMQRINGLKLTQADIVSQNEALKQKYAFVDEEIKMYENLISQIKESDSPLSL